MNSYNYYLLSEFILVFLFLFFLFTTNKCQTHQAWSAIIMNSENYFDHTNEQLTKQMIIYMN